MLGMGIGGPLVLATHAVAHAVFPKATEQFDQEVAKAADTIATRQLRYWSDRRRDFLGLDSPLLPHAVGGAFANIGMADRVHEKVFQLTKATSRDAAKNLADAPSAIMRSQVSAFGARVTGVQAFVDSHIDVWDATTEAGRKANQGGAPIAVIIHEPMVMGGRSAIRAHQNLGVALTGATQNISERWDRATEEMGRSIDEVEKAFESYSVGPFSQYPRR
jgi:hypothetical protein